jgi:4-hydroxythreonine-4-phosphate dehydrogenase
MMLLNKDLKFSLVTRHIALEAVPRAINKYKLQRIISITNQALKNLFLIKEPRLVVCGLNPHASDNGVIGSEENQVIKPVIAGFAKTLKNIYGPLPADVAIKKANQHKYDCIIAMYHDQALIPLKLLGDESGVNLTLGLPFIRTSPLHGTAFDIAATKLANPDSMLAAINLAIKCTLNQKRA